MEEDIVYDRLPEIVPIAAAEILRVNECPRTHIEIDLMQLNSPSILRLNSFITLNCSPAIYKLTIILCRPANEFIECADLRICAASGVYLQSKLLYTTRCIFRGHFKYEYEIRIIRRPLEALVIKCFVITNKTKYSITSRPLFSEN